MSRQIIITLLFLLIPAVSLASSVVRTGNESSFAVDQIVEGDFYWLASTPVVSGEVTEDLFVMGGEVTATGKVGGDIGIVGGVVDFHGEANDDVRIVGGEVTVSGEIKGDLVVVAGNLKVLSTAKVSGDVLFFGGEADISGEVGKSILGTSDRMRVDGLVSGDIQVRTGQLLLGERTEVAGFVRYTSSDDLVRAQGAVVEGKVTQDKPIVTTNVSELKDLLVPFLVLMFAALVWYLLFSRFLDKVSIQANLHPLRSLLIGFGLFFVTPVAVLILLVSTLGSFLGLTLMAIYFALLLISVTVASVVAGMYLMKLLGKSTKISIVMVVLGMSATYLLLFIPIIGPVLFLSLFLITLGALTTFLYRTIRFD